MPYASPMFAARPRTVALLIASLSVLIGLSARAADRPAHVGDASDALPGLRRVGVVDTSARPGSFSVAATFGYGFTEARPSETGAHHRATGLLAAGITTARWLDVALGFGGRYDLHPNDGMGRDDGWVFDPSLKLRSGGAVGPFALGAELVGTLPGSESLATSFEAASLDAKLLLGSVGEAFSVASFAGFRYDRSAAAGKRAPQLRSGDRLALGLSDFNSVLLGVGGAYRVGKTLLFVEATGDVLIGRSAPPFGQSPLRATVGVRKFVGSGWSLEALGDVGLSSRPLDSATAPLIPIEPRFTGLLGVRYRFGEAVEPPIPSANPAPAPLSAPPPLEAPRPAETDVEVAVTDDLGAPIKEAKVEVVVGDKTYELQPDASRYRASHVPLGKGKLSIRAEGRKPIEQDIELRSRAPLTLEIRTEQALPSGQVRGLVRSFDGKPITAKITVEPKGLQTHTDGQGFFQIDVPPGSYEVIIEAKGYRAQRRSVVVEKDGVLILNADLARGR